MDDLGKKAVAGEHYGLIESVEGKTKSDYLKGADATKARLTVLGDGLVPGLFDSLGNYTSLFRLARRQPRHSEAIAPLKKQAVEAFRANRCKMEAWTALKRPMQSGEAEKLAKQLDTLFESRVNAKAWTAAVTTAEATVEWKSDSAWVELLKNVAVAYGQIAQKKVNG